MCCPCPCLVPSTCSPLTPHPHRLVACWPHLSTTMTRCSTSVTRVERMCRCIRYNLTLPHVTSRYLTLPHVTSLMQRKVHRTSLIIQCKVRVQAPAAPSQAPTHTVHPHTVHTHTHCTHTHCTHTHCTHTNTPRYAIRGINMRASAILGPLAEQLVALYTTQPHR